MSYIKQDESGGGGGDTYNLLANQDGIDVNLNLDAAVGADSQVKLKAGSNITLTEAGTNSISIDAAGGSPGGSDTQVQFNDGGAFGGDSGLQYNKTNSHLGIGTSPNPSYSLITANNIRAQGQTDATRFGATSAGSQSSPRFTNFNNNNTGMYFPGTNQLAFSTGGIEKLRISSAGQIGLGGANYGAAGEVLTSNGASPPTWQAVGGGGTSFAQYADMSGLFPTAYPFVQTACIAPFGASSVNQSVSTISNDIHFSPMLFTKNVNIAKLWYLNGGTTNPVEIGVYETDSNNLPTNKIISANVSSPVSNASVTVNITSTALTANEMYWIAMCNTTTNANVSVLNVSSPSAYTSTGSTINRGTIAITTGTINALPSSITQGDLIPFIRPPVCGVWLA